MSIRVILADDHPVVREGLRYAIEKRGGEEVKIVGEASNGKEVLEISQKSPADVYILDVSMPELNGIGTAERLIEADPACKIIILSIYDSRILVEKAFRCGVRGYILKESATEEVIQAIREVYKGRFFLSPVIAKYIVDGFIGKMQNRDGTSKETRLTKREKEILQLIAEGHTSKEIATKLNLYLNTVHVHRRKIMHKLDIHKYADLVRYAIKEGIAKL
jgi:two-component system NarL family response regulator